MPIIQRIGGRLREVAQPGICVDNVFHKVKEGYIKVKDNPELFYCLSYEVALFPFGNAVSPSDLEPPDTTQVSICEDEYSGASRLRLQVGEAFGYDSSGIITGDWVDIALTKEIDWSRYSRLWYDITLNAHLESADEPGVDGYFHGSFGGGTILIEASGEYSASAHRTGFIDIPSNDISGANMQIKVSGASSGAEITVDIHSLILFKMKPGEKKSEDRSLAQSGWTRNYPGYVNQDNEGNTRLGIEVGPAFGVNGNWNMPRHPHNYYFHEPIDWSQYSSVSYDISLHSAVEPPNPQGDNVWGSFRGYFGDAEIAGDVDGPTNSGVYTRVQGTVDITSEDADLPRFELNGGAGCGESGIVTIDIHSLTLHKKK